MATLLLLLPAAARGDMNILFLVDRSGSMWARFQGVPKIVQVAEAIEAVDRQMPKDVAMGLRVYPPGGSVAEGADPGLWIPLGTEGRDRLPSLLKRLNPRGRASLKEHLTKAIADFPRGEGTKLLILFCDGADTRGSTYCTKDRLFRPPRGLRFHVLALNVEDEAEREELACLARQLNGTIHHIDTRDALPATLSTVCREALRDERGRQRREEEEARRLRELRSKTRLKVTFRNTLDPFFADSVEIVSCFLDGEEIPVSGVERLPEGAEVQLFDKAMSEGKHRLRLKYRKWKGDKGVLSREGVLQVDVKEGKTSYVKVYPRGGLLHWNLLFEVRTD